ncbi:alpha/beta hydrolase [Phytopseudomonas dryadis]|uniref:Alpha/beta hydrolase n=1 Tax=Phytopseudomonas dryadis TaxID=2487520 RepID=A0ABY1ZBX2_9GAMM|nr:MULTISPECIES: alpha/beta hydrolase [Pseudomonas]TBV07978.1 alpha/beta hydrolase [Pseudomonas dryadis]TBV19373.1 alpha/beta hydrolase [Pseudomonas sp. FRB 230]
MSRAGLLAVLLSGCSIQAPVPPGFSEGLTLAARAQQVDAYPQRETRFADGVIGLADVVYATREGFRPLTLDLYLPSRSAARPAAPLLIYVHGGGWSAGHARASGAFSDFPAVLARFAARGYAVASINYRLSGEARFPAPLEDVRAAMAWLREQAATYALDADRVALWGGSAGGHLAALAALRCTDDCPKVLVSWYGVHDLQALRDTPGYPAIKDAAGRLLGCQLAACKQATLHAASPVARLSGQLPATLLIHGDADRVVPHEQSLLLAAALRRSQGSVRTLIVPGVGHSLVGADQAATEVANEMALKATLAFFETHL